MRARVRAPGAQRARRAVPSGLAAPHATSAQTLPPGPDPAALVASGFAASITLVGDDILVSRTGAELRLATYPQAGAVYVFRRAGGASWTAAGVLKAATGEVGDQFGTDVAWSGDRIVIGAPGTAGMRGAAHVFERSGDDWVERARLDPDAEPRAGVGSAVASLADGVFLGAPGGLGELPRFGQPAAPQPGVVYTYSVGPDGDWSAVDRLQAPDPEGSDRFGATLAVGEGRLFVGAPGTDGARGAVHFFVRSAGEWRREGSLVLRSGVPGDRLGASLAFDGATLFAGAPGREGGGLVIAVDLTPAGIGPRWLWPPGGSEALGFGASVVAVDGTLWVGAPGTSSAAGAAYVFDAASLDHIQTLDDPPFGPGGQFGSSFGASGDFAVIGAGQADLRLGAAAALERAGPDGPWELSGTLRDPERPNMTAVTGETVSCEEGTALAYACTDVDLVAFLPLAELGAGPTSIANDIWGWTDPQTGREYVLLGKSNGTSFVDITDPNAPVYVGELPLTQGGVENLWRDIKTYAGHAFIVADNAGAHGVQIFDLTQLRDIRDPPAMFEETAVYDGVFSSHNIVINEETGFAHAVGSSGGGEACGGGLHMIDIRDPANPRFAGCFADPNIGGTLGAG